MEGQQLTQTNSCRGRIGIAMNCPLLNKLLGQQSLFLKQTCGSRHQWPPILTNSVIGMTIVSKHPIYISIYRVSSWTSPELIDKKVIKNFSVAAVAINQPSFLGHVLAFHWLIYFWWFYARDFGRCEVESHQWKTERSWWLHCCGLHWLQMLSSWNSEGDPHQE